MQDTKKRSTQDPAGAIRQLSDHPQWVEALSIRQRLQEQLRRYVAEPDAPAGDVSIVRQLVGKLLSWAKGTAATPEPEQLASPAIGNPAERHEAARLALAEHSEAMGRLKIRLATELYAAWEGEHRRTRQRIAQSVIELKEAIDAEQRLAEEMGDGRRIERPELRPSPVD